MGIDGWKYYNHAIVPACAPNEEPNLESIKNKNIWSKKIWGGKKPLLARWTTDWDCGYDAGFYYLIKDKPYEMETLSSNSRKHIRQSLKNCRIAKVNPLKCVDELYECYQQAFKKYKNSDNETSKQQFKSTICKMYNDGEDFWCGFNIEGLLIGYINAKAYDDYAEIHTAKFWPEFLRLQVSDALYHTILDYYLNTLNKSFVSSGAKNINHKTNTQDYKIKHFGYRKAYCKLHMKYKKGFGLLIRMIYPFRKLFLKFDNNTKIHQINSVLRMEEIVRQQKNYE